MAAGTLPAGQGMEEADGAGGLWCARWARAHRPDCLLVGHHQSPFVAGGAWADRLEGTASRAFNLGRDGEEGGQSRLN